VPSATKPRRTLEDLEQAAEVYRPVQDRIVYQIAVDQVRPSPNNPRRRMDGIDDLAGSLRDYGLLQPVVVRHVDDGYELIAGHRRLEAARALGWSEIAAVVRDETDSQAYLLTLTENLQRQNLRPREEAAALERLASENGWTTRQIGHAIKRSHMHVSRRMRVFEDDVLAPLVQREQLKVSTAEELLRVPDADERKVLAGRAVREGWEQSNVRRVLAERANEVGLERSVPSVTARGREVTRLVSQLRMLLAAGPIADLPPKARGELRRFYQQLALLASD
jgi:ParB family chromosome partitioning protein